MGILKGFPKSVGRVGSRLLGFPCFPHSVISMACFSPGKQCLQRNGPRSLGSARRDVVDEWIGDFTSLRMRSAGRNDDAHLVLY